LIILTVFVHGWGNPTTRFVNNAAALGHFWCVVSRPYLVMEELAPRIAKEPDEFRDPAQEPPFYIRSLNSVRNAPEQLHESLPPFLSVDLIVICHEPRFLRRVSAPSQRQAGLKSNGLPAPVKQRAVCTIGPLPLYSQRSYQ
jgi:hypothetical protein